MFLSKTSQNEKIASLKEMLNKCNFKFGIEKTNYNSVYAQDFANAENYHYNQPSTLNIINKKTNYKFGSETLKDHITQSTYKQYFTLDKDAVKLNKRIEVGSKKELSKHHFNFGTAKNGPGIDKSEAQRKFSPKNLKTNSDSILKKIYTKTVKENVSDAKKSNIDKTFQMDRKNYYGSIYHENYNSTKEATDLFRKDEIETRILKNRRSNILIGTCKNELNKTFHHRLPSLSEGRSERPSHNRSNITEFNKKDSVHLGDAKTDYSTVAQHYYKEFNNKKQNDCKAKSKINFFVGRRKNKKEIAYMKYDHHFHLGEESKKRYNTENNDSYQERSNTERCKVSPSPDRLNVMGENSIHGQYVSNYETTMTKQNINDSVNKPNRTKHIDQNSTILSCYDKTVPPVLSETHENYSRTENSPPPDKYINHSLIYTKNPRVNIDLKDSSENQNTYISDYKKHFLDTEEPKKPNEFDNNSIKYDQKGHNFSIAMSETQNDKKNHYISQTNQVFKPPKRRNSLQNSDRKIRAKIDSVVLGTDTQRISTTYRDFIVENN